MRLDRNNNNLVLYRIARNNLMSKKLSSFFSAVSIFLAVTLVATISLYITGYKIADEKILDKMQHVIYMHVTSGQVEGMADDSRIEEAVPYKFCDKKFETDGIEYKFSFLGSNTKQTVNLPYMSNAPNMPNIPKVQNAEITGTGLAVP